MKSHKVLALAFAFSLISFAEEQVESEARREEDRALSQIGTVDPLLVAAWNQTINEIGFSEALSFPKAIRAHVMMHLAMHDALNAVIPVYRQYAYHSHEPGAHAIAAAAQAAHDVAVSQYPDQQAKLDAELARCLLTIPDTPHKARGIAVGRQSAAAILTLRLNDGWDYQGRLKDNGENAGWRGSGSAEARGGTSHARYTHQFSAKAFK